MNGNLIALIGNECMPFGAFLLDIFFPIACLGCKKEEKKWLCEDCKTKIEEEAYSPKNTIKQEYLDHCYSFYTYTHPIIRKLLEAYKYCGIASLETIFAELLFRGMKSFPLEKIDVVIPMPLHKRRLRERGYNQALPLAQSIANFLNAPLRENILERKQYTTPQVNFSDSERNENMRENIFRVISNDVFSFETILLIDDVATTGATLNSAARTLKGKGVKKVIGITFAG